MSAGKYPRLLISGTNSGCGKTTVSIALMKAFKERGLDICAFKCGPDYIDPMFHRSVLGLPSYNLDPFFCTEDQLRTVLCSHARQLSVIEGVMGYYDGIGTEGRASTYSVASSTKTPVVLVINVRGMYTSAGAIIKGFKEFRPESGIKGVIFNGASSMLYKDLAKIAEDAGVKAYGFMPKLAEAEIGSRHLGLITADEIKDLQERIAVLGDAAEKNIDIDGLISLAETAFELEESPKKQENAREELIPIAVAKDEAFCFIYEENIEALKSEGFDPVWFSPLHDEKIPEGVKALYLPGGYPELYTKELSENSSMLESVKTAVSGGLPTFAECGGFLYLHASLDGNKMAGLLPIKSYRTEKLQRFGYVTLTALEDNMFCKKGESIRAHEFHYYESESPGNSFRAEKPSGKRSWDCVWAGPALYAGFPHLYLPANPQFAKNFAERALEYVPL